MTVTITGNTQIRRGGTFQSKEDLLQSTATVPQAISLTTDATTLAGGTATGFSVNIYTLAAGSEGQWKSIFNLATGESKVIVTNIATGQLTGIYGTSTGTATGAGTADIAACYVTATGAFVLSTADQFLFMRFQNNRWWIINGKATFATST